ncbi:polymorphic toxin type 30 domain-containing protein [Paenibacillus campi]|uniref:polymorphic toxin type 30 domain-containing protein n=1 Tax=Paenibacillus campi TaxID=3106031 RepID=UPI002B0032B9|nr:polymorphic toxin type 30 domain-containing protein [Paenibacillus sp. SGZ-1014]
MALDAIPFVGTVKGIQEVLTGVDWITGQQLSVADRVAEGAGVLLSVLPEGKLWGTLAAKEAIDGGAWVWKQVGKEAVEETVDAAKKQGTRLKLNLQLFAGDSNKIGVGQVGNFTNIEGASIDDILSRIPQMATRRELTPIEGKVTEGFEYKWVQEEKTMRIRVHGPDASAPEGSNAANGWIVRIQEGKKYYDPVTGEFQPPGISNIDSPYYDEDVANRTHIPIQTPE